MFLNVIEKIISSRNDVSFLYVGDGPKLKNTKKKQGDLVSIAMYYF